MNSQVLFEGWSSVLSVLCPAHHRCCLSPWIMMFWPILVKKYDVSLIVMCDALISSIVFFVSLDVLFLCVHDLSNMSWWVNFFVSSMMLSYLSSHWIFYTEHDVSSSKHDVSHISWVDLAWCRALYKSYLRVTLIMWISPPFSLHLLKNCIFDV